MADPPPCLRHDSVLSWLTNWQSNRDVGVVEEEGPNTMTINAHQFGPWAVVTGASSGIGREFAHQLADAGINVVLVARRLAVLHDLGAALARGYGVDYRAVAVDLSDPGMLTPIAEATNDIDVGLRRVINLS